MIEMFRLDSFYDAKFDLKEISKYIASKTTPQSLLHEEKIAWAKINSTMYSKTGA
jgi:hypothetical protein